MFYNIKRPQLKNLWVAIIKEQITETSARQPNKDFRTIFCVIEACVRRPIKISPFASCWEKNARTKIKDEVLSKVRMDSYRRMVSLLEHSALPLLFSVYHSYLFIS